VQVIGPQERAARPEQTPSGPDVAVGRVRDCFSSKIGAWQIVSPTATGEVKRRWTIGIGHSREQRLSVERSTGGWMQRLTMPRRHTSIRNCWRYVAVGRRLVGRPILQFSAGSPLR
jgi:hypothetical protein